MKRMWSELSTPISAGGIIAITTPKLGMNCNKPARKAHSGAHGMPMIHNPASHSSATASESWHWATNQFLSAVLVVRAWDRQSCQSINTVNHKGHEGTQSRLFHVLFHWMPSHGIFSEFIAAIKNSNDLSSCSFVSFVVKIKI